jgi:hypothetical protein
MEEIERREFDYKEPFRSWHRINIFIIIVILLYFIPGFVIDLAMNSASVSQFLYFFLILIFPIILASINVLILLMNWGNSFILSDDGLTLRYFFYWEKEVPWSDVLDIKRPNLPLVHYHAIILRKLTPYHRILGLFYAFMNKPVFVILDILPDVDIALDIIREKAVANND